MDKLIIVGSAGSPNEAVELLKIDENLNIPVIVCIHFTSSAMETFANHFELFTSHATKIVKEPTNLKPGVYLPNGGKDIVFVSENIVNSVDSDEGVHPSISHLFKSLLKFASSDVTIVVLGGLGNDGSKFAKPLRMKGVNFIIEKFPRFPYLPENIAKALEERYEKLELSKIKNVIKNLNRKNSNKNKD